MGGGVAQGAVAAGGIHKDDHDHTACDDHTSMSQFLDLRYLGYFHPKISSSSLKSGYWTYYSSH